MGQRYEKFANLQFTILSIKKAAPMMDSLFITYYLLLNYLLEVVSYAEAKGTTVTEVYTVSNINTFISFACIGSVITSIRFCNIVSIK